MVKSETVAKTLTQADAPLHPGAMPALSGAQTGRSQPPASWVAQALAISLSSSIRTLYVASGERRADEIARALRRFAPAIEVLALPPWDCLPYDRASPSHEVDGPTHDDAASAARRQRGAVCARRHCRSLAAEDPARRRVRARLPRSGPGSDAVARCVSGFCRRNRLCRRRPRRRARRVLHPRRGD